MFREANTRNVNPDFAGIRMVDPTVHMSSDSAQTQRLAQEFADDLDRFIMVPSQVEQAHITPPNHQPKFLFTNPCLQLWVTVGVGLTLLRSRPSRPKDLVLGHVQGGCTLSLMGGGPGCESCRESAGPSLLFTSWECLPRMAGLGRLSCLEEAARLLGDCFHLGFFPRDAETAFK